MNTVVVSPKCQVVIPKQIRERAHIQPGERLQVISYNDRIQFVRIRPMRSMRGFLKGLDASFDRDEQIQSFESRGVYAKGKDLC
jgi:AbrB family looped-hinge helix DNA binding protein